MTVTQPYVDARHTLRYTVSAVKDHEAATFRYRTLNEAIKAYEALIAQGYKVATR